MASSTPTPLYVPKETNIYPGHEPTYGYLWIYLCSLARWLWIIGSHPNTASPPTTKTQRKAPWIERNSHMFTTDPLCVPYFDYKSTVSLLWFGPYHVELPKHRGTWSSTTRRMLCWPTSAYPRRAWMPSMAPSALASVVKNGVALSISSAEIYVELWGLQNQPLWCFFGKQDKLGFHQQK